MIFACRSKIAPRAAKSGPRAAQERPKSGPRATKSDPRAANRGPEPRRWAQERPRRAQDGLGASQRAPQVLPDPPRTPPECANHSSGTVLLKPCLKPLVGSSVFLKQCFEPLVGNIVFEAMSKTSRREQRFLKAMQPKSKTTGVADEEWHTRRSRTTRTTPRNYRAPDTKNLSHTKHERGRSL